MTMLIIFLKVCYVLVNRCCIICVNVNHGIELKYVFESYIIFFDQVRSIYIKVSISPLELGGSSQRIVDTSLH